MSVGYEAPIHVNGVPVPNPSLFLDSRRCARWLSASAGFLLTIISQGVVAQGAYRPGDRVECDAAKIGQYRRGTVVPFAKGDFQPTGTYYRVHIDGSSFSEGFECATTHMRAITDASATLAQGPTAVAPVAQPSPALQPPVKVVAPPATLPGVNPFGTRDPRTCADTKAPIRGAITADLALRYFICRAERFSGTDLYLVDRVKVEVGGGRPYNPRSDINYSEIDVTVPIYPIRGSYLQHQCTRVFSEPGTLYNVGKNCASSDNRNATGSCYKTTFGDWRCSMFDLNQTSSDRHFQVPPPR